MRFDNCITFIKKSKGYWLKLGFIQKKCISILLYTGLCSQDAFLYTGRNFTTYDFEITQGLTNHKIEGGSGAFYEVGITFGLDNWIEGLSYAPSLTLNQHNASGGDLTSAYRIKVKTKDSKQTNTYKIIKL